METFIANLAGLSVEEVQELQNDGVLTIENLINCTYEDIGAILSTSFIPVKRKVSNIAKFLAGGGKLKEDTRIQRCSSVCGPTRETSPYHSSTTSGSS